MNYRENYKAIRRIHRNKPKRYRLMIEQARYKASKAIEALFPTKPSREAVQSLEILGTLAALGASSLFRFRS